MCRFRAGEVYRSGCTERHVGAGRCSELLARLSVVRQRDPFDEARLASSEKAADHACALGYVEGAPLVDLTVHCLGDRLTL